MFPARPARPMPLTGGLSSCDRRSAAAAARFSQIDGVLAPATRSWLAGQRLQRVRWLGGLPCSPSARWLPSRAPVLTCRPAACETERRPQCLAPRGCSRPVAAPPSSLARRHAAAAPLRRLPPRMIGALPLHDDPELVLLLSLCRPTTSAPLSYPPPLLPPSSPPPSFHRSHRRPLSPRCSRRRDRRRHRRRRRRRAHQGHPVLHVEAGHFDQIMMSSPLLTRWRPLCVCQSVTLEFNVVTNVFMQHNSICSRPRPC